MKKTNQTAFKVKKVMKKRGDKFCVKFKGYDNLFNIWIGKKVSLYKMSHCAEPNSHGRKK